jgi:hypothetical protein
MPVGLLVADMFYYELGHGDFVHSFFSTICYRLEGKKWGNVYPILMNKLYSSKVDSKDLSKLKSEVNAIRNKFLKLRPSEIIWDIENLETPTPWGEKIDKKVTSLENYFATSRGETFFEIFIDVIGKAEKDNSTIELRKV